MNHFRFIDLNYPEVIYSGTQGHFDGCERDGGAPERINDATFNKLQAEGWTERKALDLWLTVVG